MKYIVPLLFLAAPAFAQEASPEQIAAIDEALAAVQCEVDSDNIEMEDGMFDLDDVICADGQYDVKMDANYTEVERRKE